MLDPDLVSASSLLTWDQELSRYNCGLRVNNFHHLHALISDVKLKPVNQRLTLSFFIIVSQSVIFFYLMYLSLRKQKSSWSLSACLYLLSQVDSAKHKQPPRHIVMRSLKPLVRDAFDHMSSVVWKLTLPDAPRQGLRHQCRTWWLLWWQCANHPLFHWILLAHSR